jgi:ABC-type arginine transport system ATPase subunit
VERSERQVSPNGVFYDEITLNITPEKGSFDEAAAKVVDVLKKVKATGLTPEILEKLETEFAGKTFSKGLSPSEIDYSKGLSPSEIEEFFDVSQR